MECLRELSSLSRLPALDIEKYDEWKDMDDLYIVYGKLTRFKIRVGSYFNCDDFENLELSNITFREEGIEVLFSKAEILHLKHCSFETRTCLNKSKAEDFSKLRKLTLEYCDRFVHLVQRYKQEPSNVFKTLESLYLLGMPALEDIFGGFFKRGEIRELNGLLPSFQNLRHLEIGNCPHLKKLFLISKGLMKLEELKIVNCESMETIFWIERRGGGEENAVMNVVEFPQLKRLELNSLPHVTEICKGGDDSFMLPRLTELILKDVPKLTIPGFLNGKIVVTNQLEYLSVESVHQGVEIDEHIGTDVFKLRRIRLTFCDGPVATVASSHVIQKLMFLSDIYILACPTVEVVFDLEEAPPTVAVMDRLESLFLSSLPGLKHVWKHVPKGFEGFKNLNMITLRNCKSIGPSLFSPLIVKFLVQLRHLEVSGCDKMEVIVDKEDDEADPVLPHKLGFPSLKFLLLQNLEILRCFCSEPRDFVCPSLEFVEIRDCPQLTTLTVEKSFTPSLRNNDDLNAAVEAACPCLSKSEAEDFTVLRVLKLYFCDRLVHLVQRYEREPSNVFQTLDSLVLHSMPDLEEMFGVKCGEIRELNRPLPLPSFQNLRDLVIWKCPRLKKLFPISKGLMNLEKLRIKKCVSMETIFWVQRREGEENAVMNVVEFPQLEHLVLEDLPNVTEICRGVDSVVPSFQNLRHLEIWNCHRLKKLFPISKGLMKLEELKIVNCDSMETIFWVQRREEEEEENAVMNVVEFKQLKRLELWNLPHVTEICKGGVDSFMLPRLTELILEKVPKLTFPGFHNIGKIVLTSQLNLRRMSLTYCDGLASVVSSHVIQKLMSLRVIKVKGCPNIEVVFDLEGMNVQEAFDISVMDSLTELRLASLPRMTHVWKHVSKGFKGFKKLTVISLEDCNSIGPSLFSTSIVKLLVQLRRLSVSGCEKMEVIVKEDDEADPVTSVVPHKLEFPSLKFLRLEDLRILRSFCTEPRDFEWPSLKSIEIIDCPQLMTFTIGKSITPSLKDIVDLNAALQDQLPQRSICLGIPFPIERLESDENSEYDEDFERDEDSEYDEDFERDEDSEYEDSECDENFEYDEDSECDENLEYDENLERDEN